MIAGSCAGVVGPTDAGVIGRAGFAEGGEADADAAARQVVKGELYAFSDLFTVLQYLDEIEGYHGPEDGGSLFRRAIIEVGAGRADDVVAIMAEGGLVEIGRRRDLAGSERCILLHG